MNDNEIRVDLFFKYHERLPKRVKDLLEKAHQETRENTEWPKAWVHAVIEDCLDGFFITTYLAEVLTAQDEGDDVLQLRFDLDEMAVDCMRPEPVYDFIIVDRMWTNENITLMVEVDQIRPQTRTW